MTKKLVFQLLPLLITNQTFSQRTYSSRKAFAFVSGRQSLTSPVLFLILCQEQRLWVLFPLSSPLHEFLSPILTVERNILYNLHFLCVCPLGAEMKFLGRWVAC